MLARLIIIKNNIDSPTNLLNNSGNFMTTTQTLIFVGILVLTAYSNNTSDKTTSNDAKTPLPHPRPSGVIM